MIARMSKSEGIDRFSDLLVRFKARSVNLNFNKITWEPCHLQSPTLLNSSKRTHNNQEAD
jgi:hypothetical protein